jgi:adenylylsulfate reductase subunit B
MAESWRVGEIGILNIDSYRCIGCAVCVRSCLNDVLRMKEGKAYVAYPDDCSACFACEIDCPAQAVIIGVVT